MFCWIVLAPLNKLISAMSIPFVLKDLAFAVVDGCRDGFELLGPHMYRWSNNEYLGQNLHQFLSEIWDMNTQYHGNVCWRCET